VRKDGSKIPIELAINSASTRSKSLYTAIIHDLTEREKLNRVKDEFISTVSHELRTPLTSINGALGLIIGGKFGDIPNKALNMLNIAYENSDRLASLINDLLDISKIQSIETTFEMDRIEINALIAHATLSNQGYADKYDVHLLWQPNQDAIYINGDKGRLNQVLSNLFSNAVKYSPKGETIDIKVSSSNNQVRISIADSGPGIPLDYQNKIFEKFTQADSSDTRRVGGTGLGLTISKEIIEKHGGSITFESTPDHGTTFYLFLPIVDATNPTDNKQNSKYNSEMPK
jgi:signal transduction histidine kinase